VHILHVVSVVKLNIIVDASAYFGPGVIRNLYATHSPPFLAVRQQATRNTTPPVRPRVGGIT
jgi:hypothetical protein